MMVMQLGMAEAADECLASPKKPSPTGQHWYYRIDRSSKRHCWYLGERGRAVSRTATSTPSARAALFARLRSENPPAARSTDVLPQDAHAELMQGRVADTLRADDAMLTASANATVDAQTKRPDLPNLGIGEDAQSLIAARWPDPADAATAERQAAFALESTRSDASLRTTTAAVPGTSPVAIENAEAPVASSVDGPAAKGPGSVYSLFWALCGAFVLVSLTSGATYFMTRPRAAHEAWSVEPFDIARSASWPDRAKDGSARLSAAARAPEVRRRGQPASRLAS
jgi:hypothetical protein